MKISYKIQAIIFLCFIMASCKKVIDLKLSGSSSQLVIEGNITDQPGLQTVTLSKSVAFDDTNTFPGVSGATVTMTDGKNAFLFTEKTPGTYINNGVYGRYNRTYTLKVQLNGQTYTAVSTMPDIVNLDSLAVSAQSFGNGTTKTIAVYYDDPSDVKNQYRIVMYVNNEEVNEIFVRNDQFSDGRRVQALLYQNKITLKTGDKVDVDMQCIDEPIYNYWYTFSLEQGDGFTGSTTPANPKNNFNTDVLGYFSAHTTQRRTIIVP